VSLLIPFEGKTPLIDPTAFVAPGARLIGDVQLGPEASVWYNTVLRGDMNRIRIGARSNLQDGSVIHVDPPRPGSPADGYPCLIGEEVLIGHMAMIHGCTLRDRAFVGLGAIVMDGCEIEGDAMLAAGAMLTPGKRIPSGQLWAGRPARYVRDLNDADLAGMRAGVAHYVALAKRHAAAVNAASA
jgi:carbonic anhydrase/acetyltransferase-like protein (isoleucine patch superfamily)